MPEISSKQAAAILVGIVGKKAWGVRFSREGFLMLEFGEKQHAETATGIAGKTNCVPHGEWCLWVYSAKWQATKDDVFRVDSETDPTVGQRQVAAINGVAVHAISCPSNERMMIAFENKVSIEVSADSDVDEDQWMLFLPNDCVLTAEGDGRFTLEQE
jgi:hypothetical protein